LRSHRQVYRNRDEEASGATNGVANNKCVS
jgi:hypothetical protein